MSFYTVLAPSLVTTKTYLSILHLGTSDTIFVVEAVVPWWAMMCVAGWKARLSGVLVRIGGTASKLPRVVRCT